MLMLLLLPRAVQLNRTGCSLSCHGPSCILRRILVAPPRSSFWTGPDSGTCSDGRQEKDALRLAIPRWLSAGRRRGLRVRLAAREASLPFQDARDAAEKEGRAGAERVNH